MSLFLIKTLQQQCDCDAAQNFSWTDSERGCLQSMLCRWRVIWIRYFCFGSKSCLDIAQQTHVLNFKWSDRRHYREVLIVCAFVWLRLTEYQHLILTHCVRVNDTRTSHTSLRLTEFDGMHAHRISPHYCSSRVSLYCRHIFMCLFWQRSAVMSLGFTVFVVCTTWHYQAAGTWRPTIIMNTFSLISIINVAISYFNKHPPNCRTDFRSVNVFIGDIYRQWW